MTIRAALVTFGIVLTATPALAQGNSGGGNGSGAIQQLASQINALTARVNKLEGNISAADLVGTYALVGLQTRLRGGGAANAAIGSAGLSGTLTLNADGTGTLTINGDGSLLFPLAWSSAVSTLGNGNPGTPFDIAWTYANGVITPTVDGGSGPELHVGLGGRLLATTLSEFRGDPRNNDESLFIFYRLQ